MTAALPKAELHCHIEGAAPPRLVRQLAARNGIALHANLFDGDDRFAWRDFSGFLDAYDRASACIRTADDYRDIMYNYLADCAREGAVYVEVFSSPDHAATTGIGYADHLRGLAAGIDAAAAEFGIVSRIIVTCVRHLGPERALDVARAMLAEPHPYVVGFGMGGDEQRYRPADFAPAFRLVADAGYPCTVHAGEMAGPDSVREALAALPVSRIGHGVRASEDTRLLDEIARRSIVLEVCPGSNLALGVYADTAAHPFLRLREAGCRVTLNSDDPPFFGTSIGKEYADAASRFGMGEADLLHITRTAIAGSFADTATKNRLLARIAKQLDEFTSPTATSLSDQSKRRPLS
ncbi:MAG: adenosine deaminase [Rhodospirillales bacterium]|nr:adenosine deaminase [Rhodospirillales bacterium]